LQEDYPVLLNGQTEDAATTGPMAAHLLATLRASLRRWKLIAFCACAGVAITYGLLKAVPPIYKSTADILIFDPQRQIDSAVQKPISPFVDAVGYDAMSTEVSVLKSKSVALRVAKELRLDTYSEFQPRNLVSESLEWIGLAGLNRALKEGGQVTAADDAEKLDHAADAFMARVEAWPSSYIITVSTTAQSPAMAQLLTSTIANDYLASQREARQEALDHVASWLKSRVDNLRSRVLETEAAIETIKAENGVGDPESNLARGQQVRELNTELNAARRRVNEKRTRLEQARRLLDTGGDIQSIPELTTSATLTSLRQKQVELKLRADDLQSKLGEGHGQAIAARAAVASVNRQISAEAEHIFGNMANGYDLALQEERSLEANLQRLAIHVPPEAETKLQLLMRVASADRSLYESYLSQYNDVSERRTLQGASARIISPASLPKSPSSSRRKLFYGAGAVLGLVGGLLTALFIEYRPGVRTSAELEQISRLAVIGVVPRISNKGARRISYQQLTGRRPKQSPSYLSEGVHAMRINLDLTNANAKLILVTSALPGEGKSTTARLLAASSVSAGKKTLLLDCDLHGRQSPEPSGHKRVPGLSEYLQHAAGLSDVISIDPVSRAFIIPAGSMLPNAADWLMSERMRDLIGVLRGKFDYIVVDSPPLLPVVDALALATMADRILIVVEWCRTPRAAIFDAVKSIRPQAHRVAGIVLNKVDLDQLPRHHYGSYSYQPVVRPPMPGRPTSCPAASGPAVSTSS